jgi:hypothetical protein
MPFTYDDYIAQGLVPPCKRARYIASSDPVEPGDCWAPDDSTEIFVAWEQRCMETGGRYTYRKWWVPQSEFEKRKP